MRFEVPQFIEIEDKIFGPLTWKQFVYLGGGLGIAIVMFLTTNLFFFFLFGVPIGILAIALAFYPINDRPFSIFLESLLQYASNTKLYQWQRKTGFVYRNDTTDNESETTFRTPTPGTKKDITSLARELELNAMQKQE